MREKILNYIGEQNKNAFVLQIGSMDGISFDAMRPYLDSYKWPCLLIEPIPWLFDELKNNFKDRENYIFEQCAITTFDGSVDMLTIPENIRNQYNLSLGYKGMSALYPIKNGFSRHDSHIGEKYGVKVNVPALTLESLLKKHNVNKIDILLCDAEGWDWKIFDQFDLTKYRPIFIRLEYINLTDEEKDLLKSKLDDNGYVYTYDEDIDAVDKNIFNLIN